MLEAKAEVSPLEEGSLIGEKSLVEDWVLEGDERGKRVPRCENDQRGPYSNLAAKSLHSIAHCGGGQEG